LLDAEEKAVALSRSIPSGIVYVGISGAHLDSPAYDVLSGLITIRPVVNAPGIIHVARAADLSLADYLGVSRYAGTITAEIAIHDRKGVDLASSLKFAWNTATLLKLRGKSSLFCPAASSSSWDVVSGIKDNSVRFDMLDDAPRQISLASNEMTISGSDLEWTRDHWERVLRLRQNRRFALALNMSYIWNHTDNLRIAVANLWCVIEALFGNRNDRRVKASIIQRICSWCPEANPSLVGDIYEQRCNAVHGRWLEDADAYATLVDLEALARTILVTCVQREAIPLPDWT